MCGIAGYIHKTKLNYNEGIMDGMLEVLAHRGPDSNSHWGNVEEKVFLGHRRLAILDLSDAGKQPMLSNDEELVVVFNGEIYNFDEIRNELKTLGYSFKTGSDTEMILYAYKEWGIEAVSKFIGMFAIVLFDRKHKQVYFIRDRFGVKPLFIFESDKLLMFSSEIKTFYKHPEFKKDINRDVIPLYLKYGYIPTPYSIFTHVRKVRPGHIIQYDVEKGKVVREVTYWEPLAAFNKEKFYNKTEAEITAETVELLKSAFNYRMVADVPVGVFLSGGIDSSLVTALLTKQLGYKLKTFTIGFDNEAYNEAKIAKEVAALLNTEHHEYICTEKEALEIIPQLPFYYDEPFADSSAIPTMLLSKKVRSHVTVALSADGGDEIFGGYTKYYSKGGLYNMLRNSPRILKYPISWGLGMMRRYRRMQGRYDQDAILERAQEIVLAKDKSASFLKKIDYRLFSNYELKKLLKGNYKKVDTAFDVTGNLSANNSEIEKMQSTDVKTYMLDDILVKVDRATMAYSLEGREPLLDHRLFEYVTRIPSGIKFKNNIPKYLLKEIDYSMLPKELLDLPKRGFAVPIQQWLLNELAVFCDTYLSEQEIAASGVFDFQEIQKLRRRFQDKQRRADADRIWRILCFQMWFNHWIKDRD
ncbi:asparagine synthase (glutamine-hydrolyzing) [Chitinophaga sancti]|uniref:asparagine synthase (glutamine-hydrolyzing) n=1 Tax=Chitinophaga sancti TaxID=1004 RepID=A0A1K1MRM4_9BACT|nr:asparagine synthase (glutamine-hydrolyzing) [Chitinophaga sancti]WQD62921.1 asparagine synthase (glutamine-hydrolyzing) [Chitinophaga sancti]WQG91454.1 asparagine synthase (glutamine-hydrolyzing) [Chitinophaga sancti]SFW25824.1 asparagine synthase (glutamine-hydrolysing) [Chitinophaga sancti]